MWFIANIFGISEDLDAYNLCLILPTLITGIFSGFLQTGLFPIRAELKAKGDAEEVASFERTILVGVAAFSSLLSLICLINSHKIALMIAPEATITFLQKLEPLVSIGSALIAINMIDICISYLLAMRNYYWAYVSSTIPNAIIGVLFLLIWPEGGINTLIFGTITGQLLQTIICAYFLNRSDLKIIGKLPNWHTIKLHWRRTLSLSFWILPGVVFSNFIVSLPPYWMAQFGEGALSAFGYAYRFHSTTVQLLITAGSTIILKHFSELESQNKHQEINRIISKAAKASVLAGSIAIIGVWSLGEPLLMFVFSGKFDSAAATRVSSHWLWLTLGIPFTIISNVFAKHWQSQKKPKVLSMMAFISLLTLSITYMITQKYLGELSCAAAITASGLSVVLAGIIYNNTNKKGIIA